MKDAGARLAEFWQPSPGKNVLIATTLVVWCILGASFILYGYDPTWRLWGIQTQSPFFSDFRVLPGMVQSIHMGLDPSVQNPGDPFQRVFNYPSVWYLLTYTGLSQADTLWAGVALLCLFFLGVFLFPGPLRKTDVIGLLLVAFSPAAMLLYERANVDLLIFFLCALAIATYDLSSITALVILGAAAVLKLFPIFGLAAFLSKTRRTFLTLMLGAAVLFALYAGLLWRDIHGAWDLTPRGKDHSYGVQVVATHFAGNVKLALKPLGFSPKVIPAVGSAVSYSIAALIGLAAIWLGLRASEPWPTASQRNLRAFWIGAALYAGTFLLGNNWDYRLAFLLFIVPQLLEWARSQADAKRVLAWITLALVVLACWYGFYHEHSPAALADAAFLADEAVDWLLFGLLAYLLAVSVPVPLRSIFGVRAAAA